MKRITRTAVLTVGALIAALGPPSAAAHAADDLPRVDLRVLVVSDGGPAVDAIAAELEAAGTPYTEVDLTLVRPPRPRRRLPRRHRGRAVPGQVPGGGPAQRQPVPGELARDDGARRLRADLRHPAGRRLHLRASGGGPAVPGRRRLRRQYRRGAGRGDRRGPGGPLRLPGRPGPLRGQRAHRGRELRLPFDPRGRRGLHPVRRGRDPGPDRAGLAGGGVPARRAAGTRRPRSSTTSTSSSSDCWPAASWTG
ncbi:hypothetical protein SHIRM173S_11240 [Streptomyces hirsutus]